MSLAELKKEAVNLSAEEKRELAEFLQRQIEPQQEERRVRVNALMREMDAGRKYSRVDFERTDRRRYVDAETVPYAVPPGIVRQKCRGVLLGCQARITHLPTKRSIDCVTADFSGNSIGEASLAAARFFNPKLSARVGDDQPNYLYEFWPNTPAVIGGEQYRLIPAS